MIKNRRLLLSLLLFLSIGGIIPAEAAVPANAVKLYLVNLTNEQLPPLFLLDPQGRHRSITASRLHPRRSIITQKVGGELRLYAEQIIDGKKVKRSVASFTLADETDQAYMYFYYNAKGKMKSEIIEDPEGLHPAKSIRFINLCETPIVGMVDKKVYPLKYLESKATPVITDSEGIYRYSYAVRRDGEFRKAKSITRGKIRSEDKRELFVFAYRERGEADPQTGEMVMKWRPFLYRSSIAAR